MMLERRRAMMDVADFVIFDSENGGWQTDVTYTSNPYDYNLPILTPQNYLQGQCTYRDAGWNYYHTTNSIYFGQYRYIVFELYSSSRNFLEVRAGDRSYHSDNFLALFECVGKWRVFYAKISIKQVVRFQLSPKMNYSQLRFASLSNKIPKDGILL